MALTKAQERGFWKKRIAELEKENAELKSIADFQTSSNMDRYFQLKRSKEQLTKAKSLLKQFLTHYENKTIYVENMSELLSDAEQFLKDSEVEK